MKSEVSSLSSQHHLDNVTMDEMDLDYCIRNVSVQTGEEFSPQFLQNLTHRRKLHAAGESSQEFGKDNEIPQKIVQTVQECTYTRIPSPNVIDENEKIVYEYHTGSRIDKKDQNVTKGNHYPPQQSLTYTNDIYNVQVGSVYERMKFLCSFGGRILTRPSDGKLRYVGGETRIISVRKNLDYRELMKKTYAICNQPHIIKYQLPGDDLDALISVSSDEDFHHMIDEYQELEKHCQRLRIFLECLNEHESPCSSRASSINEPDNTFKYVVAVNGIPAPTLHKSASDSNTCLQIDPPSSVHPNFTTQLMKTSCMQSPPFHMPVHHKKSSSTQLDVTGLYVNHSVSSQYGQTNVDFKKPMILDTEEYQHLVSPLERQQSIATTVSSDTVSNQHNHNTSVETNPFLLNTSEESDHILTTVYNENDRIIHDLLIPNTDVFAPISIETSLGDMNLSQSSGDIPKFLPPDILLSTTDFLGIQEKECVAQLDDKDTEDDKRMREGPISDTTMAEIQAGLHGLQTIKNADLEELCELGCGTFGTVYHGKWRGTDVAIKRIKESCFAGKTSEQDRLTRDFWREAQILSQLHHPNVVALYGVVRDGPGGTLSTVTEYMANGSLRRVLSKKKRALDQRKKLIIAQDAAIGMEYLHLKNIVHFDLKCDNLLVNLGDPERPVCKVGDFGLSRIKRNSLVSGGARGTLPWIAPELLDGTTNRVSEKVDVFSFGIAMWEILTGEEPYADMHCGAIIGGIVTNTLRPPIPRHCDDGWKSLMEECWSNDPIDRPSFTEITNKLQAMSVTMQSKQQKRVLKHAYNDDHLYKPSII